MDARIEARRSELAAMCERRRVQSLELFGSATGETFDPMSSDLDFLVRFRPMTRAEYVDAYFGLKEDLEALFGRAVDLVEATAVRNPYFLRAIGPTRVPLYAA
jgi:predicted nucleotidyltransferase